MKSKLFLITLLFCNLNLLALPPGLNCDNPIQAVIGINTATHTGSQDQWYVFTAPKDGRMILSTCGTTSEDTYVEVYEHYCSSFASYYNNWGCDAQAELIMPVFKNNIYYIRWAGIFTTATYTWKLSIEDLLPGEFCISPKIAKVDTNECDHTQNIDQWFVYKAPKDGYVTISSCELTSEDTHVGVYPNCFGSFIVESNDNCNRQSNVKFAVRKDQNYYIKWYKHLTSGKYKWILKEEPPLPGETCSYPKIAQLGTNNFADHSSGIEQWFSYKATKNCRITVNTCGLTTERTYLMTYDNCQSFPMDVKNVACGLQTKAYFMAIKDQNYYFRWSNAYTNGTYFWELRENDALPGEFSFIPITAHVDTNYADHSEGIDQWFIYTATKNGSIEISSCNLTSENTFLSVYHSNMPNSPIISNNDACGLQSKVKIECAKGASYLIKWQNLYTSGMYKWILKELDALPGEYAFNAITANKGINTANHNQNIDQWFVYRPSTNCKLRISNCGYTTENTALAIYDSANFIIEKYYANDVCGNQSELFIQGIKGRPYYIRWFSSNTSGIYDFIIEELEANEGEFCIVAKTAQKGINTTNHLSGKDQWFKYTATKDGKIVISTCDMTGIPYGMLIKTNCESNVSFVDYYVTYCETNFAYTFQCIKNQTYFFNWINNNSVYDWFLSELDAQPGEFCVSAGPAIKDTNVSIHQEGRNLWFYYVPSKNGMINVSTCGLTSQYLYLGVFDNCQSFKELSVKTTYCENFQKIYSFQGIKGKKYYLMWSGMSITQPYKWVLTESEPIPGDFCISALPALKDTNISDHTSNPDRWYAYTARVNGSLKISNCGFTLYDTYLEVYNSCADGPIASNNDNCFNQSEVIIPCKYGKTYYILWKCPYEIAFPWTITEISDGTSTYLTHKGNLQIYPNPAKNLVYIELPNDISLPLIFNIYNLQGKLLKSNHIVSNQNAINVSLLNEGMYLVELKNSKITYRSKLIIRK